MKHQSSSNASDHCKDVSGCVQKPPKEWKLGMVFLFFTLFTTTISAQQIQDTGKVEAGDVGGPLPGVTVLEKGVSNGTSTDFDGEFSLSVSGPESVLVFSYIGYSTKEIVVGNQTTINLVLEEDVNQLDEVVLIDYGYGKVQQSDMTGSVATMSSTEIAKIPVASAAEVLSGRLPGVNVTTADGEPGAEIRIRVRGGGSITQDNSPLFVVDGFIVSSITDVPPNDIQSIDVLKDAAATAVYGAQASNGVVVITTKSPTVGKVSISYNNYFQFNELPKDRRYEVLSPYEYVMANYEYAELQGQTAVDDFEKYYGKYDDLELYKYKQIGRAHV